jgi:hypothetical protein
MLYLFNRGFRSRPVIRQQIAREHISIVGQRSPSSLTWHARFDWFDQASRAAPAHA